MTNNDLQRGDLVLAVERTSKKYCRAFRRSMYYGLVDAARETVGLVVKSDLRPLEFWALTDVSFDLYRGQILGITGRNGSGKTTLIRLISGIYPMDKGRITLNGKVATLFANSIGMHPHFTGRQNVYIKAALHGMSRQETKRKLDEIIAFSELERFIDSPLGTYSAGMKARLGYSIAAAVRPDLLIVDEGLAVGDIGFKRKCYDHIRKLAAEGMAVIFASSAVSKITKVSTRIMVLDQGRMIYEGNDIGHGVAIYQNKILRPGAVSAGLQDDPDDLDPDEDEETDD